MYFPFLSPLQLKIQDVHLRFEDGVTNPSRPFAFGICIKNVSMQNAANEPVSMRSDHRQRIKLHARRPGALPSVLECYVSRVLLLCLAMFVS
jgi:hypothetical protein